MDVHGRDQPVIDKRFIRTENAALAPRFSLWDAPGISEATPSAGPVIVDLGDFVPETYLVRFSIDGRQYEVQYQEARVDEVLALLVEASSDKPPKELAEARRRYVNELYRQNLTVGDPVQLVEDMKLVPYSSLRGGLDVYSMYASTQLRVKKKDLGAMTAPTQERRGFLGRLRFW